MAFPQRLDDVLASRFVGESLHLLDCSIDTDGGYALTWVPVSGDATLCTFTVCHRGPGAFQAETPYVIALAELTEQPRPCLVLGNLVGTPVEEVRTGMPLTIAYQEIPGEDITRWRWVAR